MKISRILLLKGAIWTAVVFSVGQLLRLATNVILARLLAPELFGIMQIVYSFRNGIELISDVGISQNIIHNKNANEPDFYNSAWSLQLIRGIALWVVFCVVAAPVAKFYNSSILALVMPIAALSLVLSGFTSTSHTLVLKRLKYGTRATFDATVAFIFSITQVIFAYLSPTVWALVFGSVAGTAINAIGSHFLLRDVRHKFYLSRRYIGQILSFGKWIFVSSIIYFLSTNFDRLYLAKILPLQLLGVYGIARTFSELLSAAVLQLGNSVIFPFVSSHSEMPRVELHKQLAPIRFKFLLISGIAFSIFATTADLLIRILYDQRYNAASWMLPVLIIGAWFAIMSNLNESTLMGLGRPNYGAFANSAKFGFLLIALPLSVAHLGVVGGVFVIAASDLCRFVPILIGQIRERFSFGGQDLLVTLVVFSLIALWEWLRWAAGFGTSFDFLPIKISAMFLVVPHMRPSELLCQSV
jgi:O-antigen/teichoic acid export membrane protein